MSLLADKDRVKSSVMRLATGLAICAAMLVPASQAKAGDENILKIGLFWVGSDLDPAVKWNGWTLPRLAIGETLIGVDPDLQFQPLLAESWEVIDDKTTRFTIRSGATFHNGEPVTAAAVKASIERAMQVTGRTDVLFPVASITADGQILTITTSEPFSTLINVLADPVYTIVTGFDAEGFGEKPIATGPFKVDKFDADAGVWTSRHADHWGGKPQLDGVHTLLIRDGSTRVLALQSGEIDLTTQLSSRDLDLLEASGEFNVLKGPNARIFMARFNMQKPYMQNDDFRQALVSAINRDAVAQVVNGYVAKGPFPPVFAFSYQGEEPFAYDPQAAMKLLDGAGIVDGDGDGIREYDGQNIVLEFFARSGHGADAKNSGIVIQSALKNIGIGMNVSQVKSFGDIVEKGEYDMIWERWTAAPTLDPLYFLELSFTTDGKGNKGGYSNPAYDAIIAELRGAFAKEDRASLAQDAVSILLKDAPAIFFYHGLGNIVSRNNVTGVSRYPTEIVFINRNIGKE